MELNFCPNCDNMMELYSDEEVKTLYLGCKCCGIKTEYLKNKCIYSNEYNINLSEIINMNDNLVHDITLPVIKNNPNISCPNTECSSHKDKSQEIIYIKYDKESMGYMYVCKHCSQKWTNR